MKFLPVIFMDAMRDSPEASVHMFESKWDSLCIDHAIYLYPRNLKFHCKMIISVHPFWRLVMLNSFLWSGFLVQHIPLKLNLWLQLYEKEVWSPSLLLSTDSQENPELIWNDEAREKVSQEVAQMTEEWVLGRGGGGGGGGGGAKDKRGVERLKDVMYIYQLNLMNCRAIHHSHLCVNCRTLIYIVCVLSFQILPEAETGSRHSLEGMVHCILYPVQLSHFKPHMQTLSHIIMYVPCATYLFSTTCQTQYHSV